MSEIIHLFSEEGALLHLESGGSFGEGSEDLVNGTDVVFDFV